MPKNPIVLVVDDDLVLLKTLEEQLSNEGYNVLTASNGEQGMNIIRTRKPDLALLDIIMPLLNGKQLLQKAKKESPSVKIIMLTGHGDIGSALECRSMGADDFMEKPFEMEDLLSSIRYVLKESFL